MLTHRLRRARFVDPHKPAVADDVSRKDCGKAADGGHGCGRPPGRRSSALSLPQLARRDMWRAMLARVVGIGIETADMLVHEVLSRPMSDRRAVARYAGLTGARLLKNRNPLENGDDLQSSSPHLVVGRLIQTSSGKRRQGLVQ